MEQSNIIEIQKACFMQAEQEILSNVNFSISKGEFVFLVGKVGSGKSTLMRSLYAELAIASGEVKIAGFSLSKIKDKEVPFLRRKLGIVFQDFQLLTDRSVYENLNFVLKATDWKNSQDIKKRISEVLEEVELSGYEKRLPIELSGGEQQRVVIARSLLNKPDIILADEPTGNLDPQSSDQLMAILTKISESGKAVLMATHDYPLIDKYYARTLKIEDKTVKEVDGDKVKMDLLD